MKCQFLKKYVKWLESLIRGGYAFTDVNTIKSAKFEIYSPSAQGSPLAATLYTVAHNLVQICYDNLNCNWKLVIENINIGQISFADDSAIATDIKKKEDITRNNLVPSLTKRLSHSLLALVFILSVVETNMS